MNITKLLAFVSPFFLTSFLFAQSNESTIVEELKQLSDLSQLPLYRQDSKVAMLSSYDPTGGNDDGFSGKYSFIRKEGENRLVMADLKGPGIIQRIWTPIPTTDTIEFYFDGEEEPRIRMKFEDLFSSKLAPFKTPLVGNEVGGYYNYVPIPYEKSCKIVYVGDDLKFYQIQYRSYDKSKKVTSFSMQWNEDEKKAFEKVNRTWTQYEGYLFDLESSSQHKVEVIKKKISINPGETIPLVEIEKGGRILGMTFENGTQLEGSNTDLIFKANWDYENEYAINAPMASIFGYAFGKRSMKSMLIGTKGETNYCYLPMPFDDKAVLEFEYLDRKDKLQPMLSFEASVYYSQEKRNRKEEGKLYAVWRRENPKKNVPYTILKENGKGHHVGTILLCQSTEKGDVPFPTGFFEGDDISTIDGEIRMHGTGSEDYFNGGWYGVPDRWDDVFSLPLHGSLNYSVPLARTGAYRFYLGDKVNFNKNYELTIEHGPEKNEWEVDYSSIAFYYGDSPASGTIAPSLENTKGFVPPKKMEVYLNFFNIQSLGFPYSPVSVNYKHVKGKEVFLFHSEEDWTYIKTNLNLPIANGDYNLYVSYFKSPTSGELRLFQRQKSISGWIDISSDEPEFVERQLIGRVALVDGSITLTFKTKGNKGKCDFNLERMYLVKEEDNE